MIPYMIWPTMRLTSYFMCLQAPGLEDGGLALGEFRQWRHSCQPSLLPPVLARHPLEGDMQPKSAGRLLNRLWTRKPAFQKLYSFYFCLQGPRHEQKRPRCRLTTTLRKFERL